MNPFQLRVRQIMHRYREVLHTQGPDVALAGIEGEIATLVADALAEQMEHLEAQARAYEMAQIAHTADPESTEAAAADDSTPAV